jgi:Integrase core domain
MFTKTYGILPREHSSLPAASGCRGTSKKGAVAAVSCQPTACSPPSCRRGNQDGGVENYTSAVDKLVDSGLLKRILAQTEIRYSNSLIESWWRVIKHQWLFLNILDTVTSVKKMVAFYVEHYNSHLPHSAFNGQTPDEMYFRTGDGILPDHIGA